MATIGRYPFTRHYRGDATSHVVHLAKGRTVHSGVGQSFWFRPLSAVISEVPVDDRELPLMFHANTNDFQDVAVQATVTFRFADPEVVAGRINFALDPETGSWRSTPIEQVQYLLSELAQQYARDVIAGMTLTEAVADGVVSVRIRITEGMTSDARLEQAGIGIVGIRVVGIKPEPEMERALQTPAREQAQQEADKATFERRALAVERERAISENEMQSQIELAKREEQLVAQRGANERRQATEVAAAERISTDAQAEQLRIRATADAERVRLQAAAEAERVAAVGDAQAQAERAAMDAYRDADARVLAALALRQLAEQLPQIGTLNLSPDVLSTVISQMTARGE